ncbi:hypothetical protein SRHO_G00034050 [Serrasalmus rhombeus]
MSIPIPIGGPGLYLKKDRTVCIGAHPQGLVQPWILRVMIQASGKFYSGKECVGIYVHRVRTQEKIAFPEEARRKSTVQSEDLCRCNIWVQPLLKTPEERTTACYGLSQSWRGLLGDPPCPQKSDILRSLNKDWFPQVY